MSTRDTAVDGAHEMHELIAGILRNAAASHDRLVNSIADAALSFIVQPFCNKHRLRFSSGHGMYAFYDCDGELFDIDDLPDAEDVVETLELDEGLGVEACLADYMSDYECPPAANVFADTLGLPPANDEGLTFAEWLAAAFLGEEPPLQAIIEGFQQSSPMGHYVHAWKAGEDPTEYAATRRR